MASAQPGPPPAHGHAPETVRSRSNVFLGLLPYTPTGAERMPPFCRLLRIHRMNRTPNPHQGILAWRENKMQTIQRLYLHHQLSPKGKHRYKLMTPPSRALASIGKLCESLSAGRLLGTRRESRLHRRRQATLCAIKRPKIQCLQSCFGPPQMHPPVDDDHNHRPLFPPPLDDIRATSEFTRIHMIGKRVGVYIIISHTIPKLTLLS